MSEFDSNRSLYVQMSDAEYLKFRDQKELYKYSPAELAVAMVRSIKENGGVSNEQLTDAYKNEHTRVAKYVDDRTGVTIVLQVIYRDA